VVEQCLEWALAAREPYGVWGGLSTEEREALLQRLSI
jgi:WhiB family redox-sensing transcriptional regulator